MTISSTPADQGINAARRDEAIRLLARGFSDEFATFCSDNEALQELMMDLAWQFVNDNIPIVDEEAHIDVASELLAKVRIVG